MPGFSPRQMVKRILMDRDDTVLASRELWACLTCARCSVRCPAGIDFPEFARTHRVTARSQGHMPQLSHHGTLQTIMSLQTRPVQQKRTDWAREAGGQFAESGDVFFFVGCAPFLEAALPYGGTALDAARGVLKLINLMGITPVISDQERCCGHDALWSGDEATFTKLAQKNLEAIKASGAKTVLFSCPEGYMTFRDAVPKFLGNLPFEVAHVTEFLARELPKSGLTPRPASNGEGDAVRVTFQDPCRLGRKAGIYDAPRDLLRLIPGVTLDEMPRNRENALCCGTSAWMECSAASKAMQVERIEEARDTGAGALITACPKCRIHMVCAESNTDLTLPVEDIYDFLLRYYGPETA